MKKPKIMRRKALLIAALGLSCATAYAYNVSGTKWPGAATHLYIGMPGTAASGVTWSEALHRSALDWTANTPFTFNTISSYKDPCAGYSANSQSTGFPDGQGDGLNGADFTTTVCGNDYGTNVLAVTLVYTESNLLGAFDITEADVVFNVNSRFDIYDGTISQSRGTDFERVALHELGHVIGMSHEQSEPSIMRATIGNSFTLQDDDIAGATALYTGFRNCPYTDLSFGRRTGSLSTSDCTVQELMGGGDDPSLVDVYQFTLAQPTTVNIDMTSPTLDSVLVLMTGKSEVIEIDDNSAGACNSRINRTLPAGDYALLANTFAGESDCGDTFGPYEITMSYASNALLGLPGAASLQGGSSGASFSGAVTTNNGQSYSNLVRSTQSVDVAGRITVDPVHQGQAGFIVVAALLADGEILLRDTKGQLISYDPQSANIPKFKTKTLAAVESVDVLTDTVPVQLGISSIVVDFLIGYGVDSNPHELYFHSAPINLTVSP